MKGEKCDDMEKSEERSVGQSNEAIEHTAEHREKCDNVERVS